MEDYEVVHFFVGCEYGSGMSVAYGFSMGGIAVMVLEYEDVIIPWLDGTMKRPVRSE